MSPRGEYDEDFADFELVNEGSFDYAGKKRASVESTKSPVAVIATKTVSVQSTPVVTDMDKVKEAIVELQVKVIEASTETADQIREVQSVVDNFGAQVGEQRTSQNRRMKTLEYCFDDYEVDLKNCASSIATLKEQLAVLNAASENNTDVADLRQTSKETAAKCIESASRLDFMVGYHLPSIEQNIRTIQSDQKEREFLSQEFRRTISDIKIQLGDLTEMHVMEVRKVAEDADVRSKEVQSGLCQLIRELIPVLEDKVHELASTAAKVFGDSTAAFVALSADVEAFKVGQASYRESMAVDIENLATVDSQLIDEVFQSKDRLDDVEEAIKTLSSDGKTMADKMENMVTAQSKLVDESNETKDRVSLAVEVIQHLVGKVVPRLTSRVQEQQELLQIADEVAAEEKVKSAEREAILFKRIEQLDEKASRVDVVCLQNLQLHLRVNTLEKALNELAGEVKQIRLLEHKAQDDTSISSVSSQTETATPAEIAKEIEELIDEVIEEAIEEEAEEELESTIAAPPKPPRSGAFTIHCKTLLGEAITVEVPTFVSIRYLKQLIYFKSGCKMHPTAQSLVYAGKVLQDGWRVGGGMFTSNLENVNGEGVTMEEFKGITNGATVLIVVKKRFLE